MKYTDISSYPFEPNDLVIIFDQEKELNFKLKVLSVTPVDTHIKRLECLVLETNHPNYDKGSSITIQVDSRVVVNGVVLKQFNSADQVTLKPIEINGLIIKKAKDFLDGREDHKFGASIKVLTNYLMSEGCFPEMDYVSAKRKLLKLIKTRKDWFSNSGGYLFSISPDVEGTKPSPIPAYANSSVRTVDWEQVDNAFALLNSALLCMAKSGLFGDIRIKPKSE